MADLDQTLNKTKVFEKFPQERLLIQAGRVGLYLIMLLLALMSQLWQGGFLDWGLLKVFYSIVALGLFIHLLPLFSLEKFFQRPDLLLGSFVLDVGLISWLAVKSDLNQSLFLFMYLLVIILCGLVLRTRGALLLAILSSIGYTLVSVLGPEMKSMSFLFLMVLNNMAFFVVAWLSGFLSDQLNVLGSKLELQNLSLRTIQKLNESIVETIPSGLINTNLSGQVLRSNLGASRIFGERLDAQAQIEDIVPEILSLKFSSTDLTGAPQELKVHLDKIGPDQGGREILLRVTRLTQESSELSEATYLYIFEDLTQIRELEAAVRQSEKMAAVGQLAAGIAHEIRNPLTGISGSVELLSQTSVDEDDRKLTKIILREIDRLNNLITEFLEFAKPEKIPQDQVDLGQVLKEVLELAKNQQPAGLILEVEIKSPSIILGSRDKIKQALLNIVINSYQAMVTTAAPSFHANIEMVQNHLVLRLADTGSGMTEEVRKRMFEPFMTTKPKGTGLGLAITHKIFETHGAQVLVESAIGRGTEFRISFPLPIGTQ